MTCHFRAGTWLRRFCTCSPSNPVLGGAVCHLCLERMSVLHHAWCSQVSQRPALPWLPARELNTFRLSLHAWLHVVQRRCRRSSSSVWLVVFPPAHLGPDQPLLAPAISSLGLLFHVARLVFSPVGYEGLARRCCRVRVCFPMSSLLLSWSRRFSVLPSGFCWHIGVELRLSTLHM